MSAFRPKVQARLDLESINFVSNDRLHEIMDRIEATPEQREEAVRINVESRLLALKIGLLLMAGVAFLAILPAGRLPDYKPHEIPDNPPPPPPEELREAARRAAAEEER